MKSGTTPSPLDDVEYLARSDHRVTALAALARRPQSRADLLAMTGVSQSTIGRTLREFENRNWLRRDGKHYEATQLGAFVAVGMWDLIERVETEQQLRDIWHLLPGDDRDFSIELCADATVTVATADDPYRPVNRFMALVRKTDRLRFAGFEVALLEPCKDEFCRLVREGMQTEVVDPPNVVTYIRSTYPEEFEETLASGNLTIRVHDDLPRYGVGILDDRVAIAGYDPDSGTVQALVDTTDPAAREWAESEYEAYRRETPTVGLEPTA